MHDSRRQLLQTMAGAAAFLVASVPGLSLQGPSPKPSPNAPNPSVPQGLEGRGLPDKNTKALQNESRDDIRRKVETMYALITDLRQEVSTTNTNNVLSLSVVSKAKEIEKLAKQVKDLAKG